MEQEHVTILQFDMLPANQFKSEVSEKHAFSNES